MADDVRISVGLSGHPKTKKLKRRLGAGACWSLVVLFLWTGAERWDGTLYGMTDEDIELAADWDGEPGAFVGALLEVGFLDGDSGLRAIHDWQEHNPYAASKGQRIEKGKQAAAARWEKKNPAKSKAVDATSMPTAYHEHATTIAEQCPPAPAPAPAPAPTQPVEAKAKSKADAPPAKRGQRLAQDWEPSDEDVSFAVELRVNWRRELETFRDYWHAKPGQQAVKLDWSATWRNWIRKAQPTVGVRAAEPSKSKTLSAVETAMRIAHGQPLDGSGSGNGHRQAALPSPTGAAVGGHDGWDDFSLDGGIDLQSVVG